MRIRYPAVAGTFYENDPERLRSQVAGMLPTASQAVRLRPLAVFSKSVVRKTNHRFKVIPSERRVVLTVLRDLSKQVGRCIFDVTKDSLIRTKPRLHVVP